MHYPVSSQRANHGWTKRKCCTIRVPRYMPVAKEGGKAIPDVSKCSFVPPGKFQSEYYLLPFLFTMINITSISFQKGHFLDVPERVNLKRFLRVSLHTPILFRSRAGFPSHLLIGLPHVVYYWTPSFLHLSSSFLYILCIWHISFCCRDGASGGVGGL